MAIKQVISGHLQEMQDKFQLRFDKLEQEVRSKDEVIARLKSHITELERGLEDSYTTVRHVGREKPAGLTFVCFSERRICRHGRHAAVLGRTERPGVPGAAGPAGVDKPGADVEHVAARQRHPRHGLGD